MYFFELQYIDLQRCDLIELLLPRCDHEQISFLWTVSYLSKYLGKMVTPGNCPFRDRAGCQRLEAISSLTFGQLTLGVFFSETL